MKIAEALARRKDLSTAIGDLSRRIAGSVNKQEGEEAVDQPDALLAEAQPLLAERARLLHLIFEANLRNSFVFQGKRYTLSEALAEMERLKALHGLWEMGTAHARVTGWRTTRTELRTERVIDVTRWTKERDTVAKAMRELDLAIQRANWELDLEPVSTAVHGP